MVMNRPIGEQESERSQQQGGSTVTGGRFGERAKSQGGRIGRRLRESGRSIVGEQKNRACEELESVSEVVHEAADRLHERDSHLTADYVDSFADQIENAAEFIRDHSVGDLADAVNDFARRRPEVFIGGALIGGLLLARFLKASQSAQPAEGSSRISGFEPQSRTGSPIESGSYMSEAGPIATSPRAEREEPIGGRELQGEPRIGSDRESGGSQFQRPEDRP